MDNNENDKGKYIFGWSISYLEEYFSVTRYGTREELIRVYFPGFKKRSKKDKKKILKIFSEYL